MVQAFSGVKKGSHLLLIGMLLAVMPAMVEAVGLGRLKVKSALNEPLNAEIPLTSISKREIRSLEAGLAPRGSFEALGIERPNHLSKIKFNVAKRLDGSYFLQLTTRSPYQEPFLHMLVQVEWAGGRLRREYTALIDPPYLSSGRPSSITAPRLQTPREDYEPLPEPLADEVLKETAAPTLLKEGTGKKQTEAFDALPEPLPEEPRLVTQPASEAVTSAVDADAASQPEPALPEPIADDQSGAGKSIDQIEAEAFGTGSVPSSRSSAPVESLPEPISQAQTDSLPEPESFEAYDRGDGLLGPSHIPIIPVEPQAPMEMERATAFWAADNSYKVKRGDTLFEIARRLRTSNSVTLNQVMMAIYEANPRAFYGSNINNLRAGRILEVPELERVRSKSPTAASRQFRAHYDSWQEHKLRLAQSRSPVEVASGDEPAAPVTRKAPKDAADKQKQKQADSARAKAKAAQEEKARKLAEAKAKAAEDAKAAKLAADKKAQEKARQEAEAKRASRKQQASKKTAPRPSKTAKAKQSEDLLRIVRASMLAAPSEPQAAETESIQAEKEKQKLASRMNSLEESLESKKLQNKEISDKVGKVSKNIENEKRLIDIENPSLAKGKPAEKPASTPAAKQPASKKPLTVAKTPKPARPRPAPPATQEASIVDTVINTLLGNQFMLMMIGGVVLLGAAIFAIYMKRRRKTLADFEESILSADTSTDDLSTDSQDMGDTGDTSFLSDFSQEGMGNIATDEVDPIAEADVYLAYGRDEQAEEILKDAMSKHPERAELKLKLLEIYHQRNDVSGFETLAEELYASGNARSVWTQVAEMGAQLNPENPMFKGDAPPAGIMGGAAIADAGLGGGLDMTEMAPGNAVLDDNSGMDDSLDFDIETPMAGGETEMVSPSADDGLSMDMDIGGGLDMDIPEPAGGSAGSDDTDFALDFNMDTADVGGDDSEEVIAAAPAADDDNALDFNMDFGDMSLESDGESSADDDSGLSMDGMSLDMESDDDSGLSMDGMSLDMADDDGLSFDDTDSDHDLSGMDDDDSGGLSALDMVQAEGGGLPENEDGSLDFSLDSGSDDSGDYDLSDDTGLDISGEFGMEEDSDVEVAEAMGATDADVDSDENWDEAATKLDLAKAYIDMGDADGAKSILDEVMTEGNEEQKAQASELAAQI